MRRISLEKKGRQLCKSLKSTGAGGTRLRSEHLQPCALPHQLITSGSHHCACSLALPPSSPLSECGPLGWLINWEARGLPAGPQGRWGAEG